MRIRSGIPAILLLCMSAFLAACTVKLISSYDEQTDKNVTDLQRKLEAFFVKLDGLQALPDCTYEKNKEFYDQAKVDVSAIQVRAAAIPQNEITSEQVTLLGKNLETLEKLHKGKGDKRCISPDELKPLRNAFTASFTAILKLELAKKRGDPG
jgi:hypothetical protein